MVACIATACSGADEDNPEPTPAVGLERLPPSNYFDFCDSPNCPQGRVPKSIRRPLRQVSAEKRGCPITRAKMLNVQDWLQGKVLGEGPVFLLPLSERAYRGVVAYYSPRRFGDEKWGGVGLKVLSDARYDGPILIRGLELQSRIPAGFSAPGDRPFIDMNLAPGDPANAFRGWREWPVDMRLARPGCYAVQIDGLTFSTVVVFRAELLE